MVRLRPEQRRLFATHLPELANFAAGSLLFGQFLTERPYAVNVALLGVASYLVLMALALLSARGERR